MNTDKLMVVCFVVGGLFAGPIAYRIGWDSGHNFGVNQGIEVSRSILASSGNPEEIRVEVCPDGSCGDDDATAVMSVTEDGGYKIEECIYGKAHWKPRADNLCHVEDAWK